MIPLLLKHIHSLIRFYAFIYMINREIISEEFGSLSLPWLKLKSGFVFTIFSSFSSFDENSSRKSPSDRTWCDTGSWGNMAPFNIPKGTAPNNRKISSFPEVFSVFFTEYLLRRRKLLRKGLLSCPFLRSVQHAEIKSFFDFKQAAYNYAERETIIQSSYLREN